MASSLLSSQRFLPLFLTQFLGALNDNLFKTAVVILVTYRTSEQLNIDPQTLVTLSGAMFVFPYIVFCATAGKAADIYEKSAMARLIKVAEVVFMLIAAIGFYLDAIGLLFLVLFCMGTHSAFFSPVKYALMPEQMKEEELMQANAYMEGGTFIAILLGTIMGGELVLKPQGEVLVSWIVLMIALLGYGTSRYIPHSYAPRLRGKISYNVVRTAREVLRYVTRQKQLFKSVLINSWFWFVALTFLTQFPAYTKLIIGADESVVTLFLTSFSVGIGLGTVACGWLQGGGKVSTHYVPWAVLGMSLFTFDLAFISPGVARIEAQGLMDIREFLVTSYGLRMVLDIMMIAFLGGFFVVPTYAVIQKQCEPAHRAQTMACNNIVNAAFMVASALIALALFALGATVRDVFLCVGVLNLVVGLWLLSPAGRIRAGEVL